MDKEWKERFKQMYLGLGFKTQKEYEEFLGKGKGSLKSSLSRKPFPNSLKDLVRNYELMKENARVVFDKEK